MLSWPKMVMTSKDIKSQRLTLNRCLKLRTNDYLFNDDTHPVIVRSTPGATGGTGSDDKNKEVNTAIRSLMFL